MRGSRALPTRIFAGLIVTAACALALVGPAGASRGTGGATSVPRGFIGANADGALLSKGGNLPAQLELMHNSGAPQMRIQFSWRNAQPYASWKDVPSSRRNQFSNGPGGVPTDFQGFDLVLGAAAMKGISLIPVIEYAPSWDASPNGNHAQPAHDKPYAQFVSALVKRYGPNGTYWRAAPSIPKDPIVEWQIWNEPELGYFWDTQPFAPSYVKLLRAAHSAIKAIDPSATVLLAALTNKSWSDLKSIYQVKGAKSLFDAVAVDPYTRSPQGVITILGYVRKVMNQYGDAGKPLIASEVGWPAAVGKSKVQFGFDTNSRGQATKLSQLMPLLASNRQKLNLGAYYYYTWMSSYQNGAVSPFAFSGLLRVHKGNVCAERSFSVFRQNSLSEQGLRSSGKTPAACHS